MSFVEIYFFILCLVRLDIISFHEMFAFEIKMKISNVITYSFHVHVLLVCFLRMVSVMSLEKKKERKRRENLICTTVHMTNK